MNKELVKDICDTCGRLVHVHWNAVTRIVGMEAILPGLGTVWFDNRCISKILPLSKVRNKFRGIHDSAKGNQLIVVVPDKEVLLNEIRNGIYYHDMEDFYLVLVNAAEENREVFYLRDM